MDLRVGVFNRDGLIPRRLLRKALFPELLQRCTPIPAKWLAIGNRRDRAWTPDQNIPGEPWDQFPLLCSDTRQLATRYFSYLFQIFSHQVLPPLSLGTVPRRFICVRMSAMFQPVRSASCCASCSLRRINWRR